MLATLLIGLLHAAPPAPEPAAPPRIEGLRSTWVTPDAWVPALRPGRPLPKGPVVIGVRLTGDATAEQVATALGTVEGVERVEPGEEQVLAFLSSWQDLSGVPLADERTLGTVADLVLVPRPTGIPLPGSSVSPVHPGARPLPPALPGSTASPFHPGAAPGPSPRTERPFPVPPPDDDATGWDLIIHNPYIGGPSKLSVETLGLGEADPDATVVLHDVQPGLYAVTFETPTGAKRTRQVAATQRE